MVLVALQYLGLRALLLSPSHKGAIVLGFMHLGLKVQYLWVSYSRFMWVPARATSS